MNYIVEYTDEFGAWFDAISENEQNHVVATINLLKQMGPHLPFPFSSHVRKSKHAHMRELRVQVKGIPLRIFYAFDPRRVAILLIGGNKKGMNQTRFYARYIPAADRLYDIYLIELENEGLI